MFFYLYTASDTSSDLPLYLSFVSSADPMVFIFISLCFNAILNSGSTTHIIKDHQYFWTYDSSLAVPVSIANCGTLNVLAQGKCCFQAHVNSKSVTLILSECLHAPDVPINLLLVGLIVEHGMDIHFT